MTRSLAPHKTTEKNTSKSPHPKASSRASLVKHKTPRAKPSAELTPASRKEAKKGTTKKQPGRPIAKTGKEMPKGKRVERNAVALEIQAPARLLRESKTTSAALSLLEKGIRFLHQKDIKRARAEFRALLEAHPGEPEILARVRSYLQICDREDAAHRKPVITNDQLYTLGVMDHNRGNYDGAIAYFQQSLEKHTNRDYIYYSLAASLAMKGETASAAKHLQKAIALNEENRIYAKNDSDFAALHSLKEFIDLVGVTQSPSHEPPPL